MLVVSFTQPFFSPYDWFDFMPHPSAHDLVPSPWISRFAALLDRPSRVLDLACGAGRHGLYFAAQGHTVVFVDRDTDRIAHTLQSRPNTERCSVKKIDLEDGAAWSLGRRCYDMVVVSNYLYRPHLADVFASIAEDGFVLYETFALGNEAYGRPRNPDFLLSPGELLAATPAEFSVIAYEHGTEQRASGPRVIQRLCAQRGTQPRPLNPPQ